MFSFRELLKTKIIDASKTKCYIGHFNVKQIGILKIMKSSNNRLATGSERLQQNVQLSLLYKDMVKFAVVRDSIQEVTG